MGRRIFFSTGEPSAEHLAVVLANAMRAIEFDLVFEGFGDFRMEQAGFELWERTTGWARLGPLAAAPHIPRMLRILQRTVKRLVAAPPTLIVLIDYGAFNLRLANVLRMRGYTGTILYAFPPSAWRDRPAVAQKVASVSLPLIPFDRQAQLYTTLGVPHVALGYPLVSTIDPRAPHAAAPPDGGSIGVMPGSRKQELQWNLPPMLAALDLLKRERPQVTARIIVADPRFRPYLQSMVAQRAWIALVEGGCDGLRDVDVALVKSGTVVLESALLGVPTTAMYRLSPSLAWIVRNIFHFRSGFVTLPNLVLEREVVHERLQEAATAENIATDIEELLQNPTKQLGDFVELRSKLGGAGTLARWAQYIVDTARAEHAISGAKYPGHERLTTIDP